MMEERIIEIISQYSGIGKEEITLDSDIIQDLELSSFDVTELACELEDEFELEVPDRKISSFQTVRDVVEYIEAEKGE
ncbi:MAG: acyl carrier protein [Clostridia bacterium]|nr:acyl carrier protein [Clostridia bacterium]